MAAEQQNVIHNTKQQIIKTARKLFSKYTYLGVSMSDIARKLHITKAALYYHFTGKAEIYKKYKRNKTCDSSHNKLCGDE